MVMEIIFVAYPPYFQLFLALLAAEELSYRITFTRAKVVPVWRVGVGACE
jgi:hypothetical protein